MERTVDLATSTPDGEAQATNSKKEEEREAGIRAGYSFPVKGSQGFRGGYIGEHLRAVSVVKPDLAVRHLNPERRVQRVASETVWGG